MRKSKDRPIGQAMAPWRHPLVILTVAAGLGAVVALFVAAKKPEDISITLLSNVIVFIASGLISYFITYNNERRQFQLELARIADFSRRRVDLLRANILSLTDEIKEIEKVDEVKRIVIYTLRNLEQDASASVKDIEDMGGILSPALLETQAPTEAPTAPLPSTPIAAEDTSFNCRSCGQTASVELSLTPGSTKHVSCPHCHARLTAHRLRNGSCKIVAVKSQEHSKAYEAPNSNRLSDYASAVARPDAIHQAGPVTHERFDCPRCRNTISYSARASEIVVQKPCFSCFSVCSYDRVSKIATVQPGRKPRYLPSLDLPEMECEVCNAAFTPQLYKNRDGVELVCCFSCNTIYLNKGERKVDVVKLCLTPSCGNEIRFKVSDTKSEARQFCLDCFKRLSYDNRSGEMTIVEELYVPKLTESEFEAANMECPHCHNTTSGRWTKNHKGDRLSICWSCKGVFELTRDAGNAIPSA